MIRKIWFTCWRGWCLEVYDDVSGLRGDGSGFLLSCFSDAVVLKTLAWMALHAGLCLLALMKPEGIRLLMLTLAINTSASE
jgi:hypothetical protein